jgi:eukaryotic-like serine/threonine-protein kinase
MWEKTNPRRHGVKEPPRSDAELMARVAASGHRAGQVIDGRYRLDKPLSAGGAGVVWVSTDTNQGTQVAVKLLDSHDPDSVRRMALEAQAAARIEHPGVVRVHRFGTTERGTPYLAMELLNGESFASVLTRERRISPTAAVRLLLPVADTLHAAHLSGIIHRDLKPDNVFIARGATGRLQPKVLDFGSARLIRSGSPLTAAGFAVGTPPYMSPEQITGSHAIDHRTDIWTLCVLLYRAVAGRRPFSGADHASLVMAIAHDDPTPLTDLGVGDPGLWGVVQLGLLKQPGERYPTMFALGRALAAWLHAQGIHEDTTGAPLMSSWIEPEGQRREFAQAQPSIPADIRDDELESPYRLRYEQILGTLPPNPDPAPPGPAKRRSLGWVMVVLALLFLAGGVYAYLRLPRSHGPSELRPSAESTLATVPSAPPVDPGSAAGAPTRP